MSELTELRERVLELTRGIAVLVSPNPKTDELLGALSLREAIRSELIQGALQKDSGTVRLALEQLLLIEWVGGRCPACGESKVIRCFDAQDSYTDFPGRHSYDCWLAAAIKEAQGE